ncbi:hypothetical protein PR001_g9651 [Phytophthora rubi]|uniref:Uncharacterized protein n=1 Tax=Phytophthora rubi TaxID=129364 RepID=A0A6A3MZH7_9STRA|nr:hypothetical protein PR001_g9651 [Phytophthora rubi]
MELPQGTQNDVFKQKKDEAVNKSFTTAGFREFILTTHPNPDVMSTLYLCHYAERMHAGNGTRVTLTDATHGEVFEQTSSTINDLTPLKRKPYLVQVTVWDAKQKNGCYGNTIIDFKPYCPTQVGVCCCARRQSALIRSPLWVSLVARRHGGLVTVSLALRRHDDIAVVCFGPGHTRCGNGCV